jgi:glutamine amidotransferase
MFKKIGISAVISSDPASIRSAEKLVLPGVGAFDNGMKNLNKMGLIDPLNEAVLSQKTPIIGICLGMQLMTRSSEEGILSGLGWIDAHTVRFKVPASSHLRVPNIGWNILKIAKPHVLFEGIDDISRFYFVHSYHVCCNDSNNVIATAPYFIEFTSAFARGNIMGVQFHPEKSLRFGFRILQNFASI